MSNHLFEHEPSLLLHYLALSIRLEQRLTPLAPHRNLGGFQNRLIPVLTYIYITKNSIFTSSLHLDIAFRASASRSFPSLRCIFNVVKRDVILAIELIIIHCYGCAARSSSIWIRLPGCALLCVAPGSVASAFPAECLRGSFVRITGHSSAAGAKTGAKDFVEDWTAGCHDGYILFEEGPDGEVDGGEENVGSREEFVELDAADYSEGSGAVRSEKGEIPRI